MRISYLHIKDHLTRFRVHFIINFLGDNLLILPLYLVTLFHYNTHPYRCLNSGKRIRLGKPWRQILIPSSTPLHFSCSITSGATNLPACGQHIIFKPTSQWSSMQTFFSWLGIMQRTKLGLVARSVSINLLNCSYKENNYSTWSLESLWSIWLLWFS